MQQRNALIAAGVASFLLFLILLIPASVLLRFIGGGAVAISGVSGTAWRGEASQVQVRGLTFSGVQWNLSLLRFLTGAIAGDVTGTAAGKPFHGLLSYGLRGAIACTGCEWSGSISSLQPVIAIQGLSGDMDLKLRTIEVRHGWVHRLAGGAEIRNMPLALPGQAPLTQLTASYAVKFDADPVDEKGVIDADVKDLGGLLQVQGKLRLSPPDNFQFDGRMLPRPGAPDTLVRSLQGLGPRQQDGSYSVTFAGTF